MKRWLLLTALLLWIEMWIAALVAIRRKDIYGPYPFGSFGQGHPNDVLGDFVAGNGTGLSPPLYLVILFGLASILATRSGRPGTVGVASLLVLGLLVLPGYLVEPITSRVLHPAQATVPETVLVVLSLLGTSLLIL